MLQKKKNYFGLVLISLIVLVLAACGGEQGSSSESGESADSGTSKKEGNTLNVGLDADPPQLDPHFSTAAVDRQVYQSIYDKLVDVDEDLNIIPQLAKEWEISEDGKTYTFLLQEGVTFHDGTPFNAEAVKFNLERMLDPSIGTARTSEISSIETVEAVDELTVKVQLKEAFSPFLSVLSDRAGMMVSPTAVKEKGDDFSNSPVGTGPFKFVERVKQDKIVVEANQDYWGGAPKVEKIVYRPYTDENVRKTNFISGSTDIINKIPPKDVEELKNNSNVTLSEVPGPGFQGLYLNHKSEPFNNKALRQALDLVIDRDAIIEVALHGTAVPSASAIAPSSWAYDESIKPKERDIEKAKQIMSDAGYPDGFSFTLKLPASPIEQQMAQMIQSMAAEAGIKVEIETVEFGTMLDQMDNFEFDAVRLGWSGRVDPDGNIHSLFRTDGTINYGYSNEKMDQLLDDARSESDQEKRKALYSEAMKLGQEEVPFIFIYHETDYKAYKNYVKDFKHIPDTMMRFHNISFE
jgi:peptide/nickel transport system substrate-binding protein